MPGNVASERIQGHSPEQIRPDTSPTSAGATRRQFMNWRRLGVFVLGAGVACSSVTVPANTLALLDGRGETVSGGPATLSAKAMWPPSIAPGGGAAAPAIGLSLYITKSSPDTAKPLLICVD